ncbi:MAG: hypothetical protein R3E70_13660 [Burkholderiaceae bacterium]
MKHLNSLFTLLAFVFGGRLRAAQPDQGPAAPPHGAGRQARAFGHRLSATGKRADVVLFGAFLLRPSWTSRAARQRDRARAPPTRPAAWPARWPRWWWA